MRERLSSIAQKTADIARTTRRGASRTARIVTTDALPITLATCAGSAGVLLSQTSEVAQDVGTGALGCTLALTAKSFVDRLERDRARTGRGVALGMLLATPPIAVFRSSEAMPFHFPRGDEPLYQSLDGSTTITSPVELMEAIGDPEQVATRIGVRLRKIDRGEPVTEEQVEYFRLVQAGLRLMPPVRDILCDTGQEMMQKMDGIVERWETEHKPQQGTS